MKISVNEIKQIIAEELSKTDKNDIERMIKQQLKKELEDTVNKVVEKAVKEEVKAVMGDKVTQREMADISKTIIKKLYKDLSFHHPYIIDRIKI
jgi:AAA+ ATPase superfamily predicted ATPase